MPTWSIFDLSLAEKSKFSLVGPKLLHHPLLDRTAIDSKLNLRTHIEEDSTVSVFFTKRENIGYTA